MQIVIDIPEEDIPKVQGTMDIHLSFCNGELCQCDYPFDTDIEQIPSINTEKLESLDKAKQEIRRGENKAYNADFTMGCEYAISVIERMFEEVEE